MIRRASSPSGLFDEMIIDNFAGGGGASIGIERAMGRAVDVAINHDPEAVAMHRANHPHTLHLCQDVWEVDPREVTGGRPVGLAWFSPDCTHFSKARGSKPIRTTKSRDLAWVVIRYAATVRPRVICLENVEEFQTWGPLVNDRPCPKRRGHTFRSWTKQLRDLGYAVQWRELRAHHYGTPTIRKRLFLVARCDGQPIVWPEPTHGPGLKPFRTAAECIDWSLPCPSIFERPRPLAENTLKRIAAGIKRYVIDAAEPFIVGAGGPTYSGKPQSIHKPIGTLTAENHRALVVPTLVQTGYGERKGQAPRVPGLHKPLGTLVGTSKHALVSAFLNRLGQTGGNGHYINQPSEPLTTITTKAEHCLTAAHMVKLRGTCRDGQDLREPGPTLTASGTHAGIVAALLVKYYGTGGQWSGCDEPMHTLPTKARMGLVTVHLNGEPYVITDIGMRMLQPAELYRAQGFPAGYVHSHGLDEQGRRLDLTKTAQVRMCGNSVCPPVAEAVVRANMAVAAEVLV